MVGGEGGGVVGGEGGGVVGGEGGGVGQGEGEERSRSGPRVAGDSSVSSQRVFVESERLSGIVGSTLRFHALKMQHQWLRSGRSGGMKQVRTRIRAQRRP